MRNIFFIAYAAVFCVTAAVPSAQEEGPRRTASREPVYTAAQAERGQQVYQAHCVTCHLSDLDGSDNPISRGRGAPLVGARFIQDFGESKVSALFNKMKRDMPNGNPGSLSDQEYLDVASFVLQRNRLPAGSIELTVDSAADVWIPGAGGAEGLKDYTAVSAEGCLSRDPTRSWFLTKAQTLKPLDGTGAVATTAPGDDEAEGFTFRLLDAFSHTPEPHEGHKVRVTGHLVRLGAEIRVNVQTLQMVAASCDN